MILNELREKYINHPLVNGNLKILWRFADYLLSASASGATLGSKVMLANPHNSPYGYFLAPKLAVELGLDTPVKMTEEELAISVKLMLEEKVIAKTYVTDYGTDLVYLDENQEEDKELIEDNLEAIRQYEELENQLANGEITYDLFSHLTSREAEKKIYVIDSYHGESHYGKRMKDVFYPVYIWGNIDIEPRLVAPDDSHMVKAIKQLLSEDQIEQITKKAAELKLEELKEREL